jgi:tryptophan-rich sensory protein
MMLCGSIGYAGSLSTISEIPTWYAHLAKPSWTPPPAVFPVVWTLIYIMIAVSLWRLLDKVVPGPARRRTLLLFAAQLVLNALWSPVFFALHATIAALGILLLLDICLVATAARAWRIDRLAAWLLLPYLVWVLYATTLNAGVVWLN